MSKVPTRSLAVNRYRKSIGIDGDTTCTSYSGAVAQVASAWTEIGAGLLELESWRFVIDFDLPLIAGVQCLALMGLDSRVHSVPYPLHWEIL